MNVLKKISRADAIFFVAAIIFLLIRINWGRMVSILFLPSLEADDGLLVEYANLHEHFIEQNLLFTMALTKDMGFPVFINLVHLMGLQFVDALSLLWFLAAITSVAVFAMATDIRNRIIWLAIYAFVLFTPIAFDNWGGVRFYRTIILTPLYFIVIDLILILFMNYFRGEKFSLKNLIFLQIALGIFFTGTFYVKEDGAWLLAILIAVTAICFVGILLQLKLPLAERLCRAGILFLSLIIFWGGTNFYKAVNYKYFGVYEINTRVGGETGKFVESVYKIQSDKRTGQVWAPADAINKAFDASAKLKNSPKLREWLLHPHGYSDDIEINPIRGDFLGWLTLNGMTNAEIATSIVEQENFFSEVNQEISAAFDNGTLQKDSKFQLVSSMGGRSLKEIFNLRKIFGAEYRIHVLLYKYELGIYEKRFDDVQKPRHEELVKNLATLTNMNLYEQNTDSDARKNYVKGLFAFYRVAQAILFIFAFGGMFWGLRKMLRREIKIGSAEFFSWLIIVGSFALSVFYALALAWFCEFLWFQDRNLGYAVLKSYGLGLIPLLSIFEILGAYLFYSFAKENKKFRGYLNGKI